MGVGNEIWVEGKKLVKTALIAVSGVALIFAASFLTKDPTTTFFRVLSFAGTGLLLFSIAMMVLTFRLAKSVVPGALLVSLGITCAVLSVQILFASNPPSLVMGAVLLLGGVLVGIGWSLTTIFFVDAGNVRSRGSAWYLVVWALTFMVHQAFLISAGQMPQLALIGVIVATGIAVGNTLGQLSRYRRAKRRATEQSSIEFNGVAA